ncbi:MULTISPECIES: hypothetical protein [unclassified Methanoregula]|uniref:hypothetical protein n=1 Tax=unclassified Methanoregula TaxID=2649730 RepID=UPI0009C9D99D|nr:MULTISPECIES: hypothetical protein [unclassified Methanoregula]OPX64841.1 MAG: hypothetical protein A4E33_00579 [Methanoregula sp. PtaB.Bin085]OPY32893.1 MAG: hypothetical protein A4E34_02270 [Methanoregula sp. PtaU1.Bin006]
MRRVWFLLLLSAVLTLNVPVAGQQGLTISATPENPHIGDTVTLSGTVTGINTIAVYLFVTGPGLDPRGATLDNLNIATGHGLFTTAPVNMENGTWSYSWDTSVILGTLKPGHYTIHVVASPFKQVQTGEKDSATVDINFRPSQVPRSEAPLDPLLPVVAVATGIILFVAAAHRRR